MFSLINVERQAFVKWKAWIEPPTAQSGGNHADRLATAAALVPRSWVFISPTLVRVLDHEGRILFKVNSPNEFKLSNFQIYYFTTDSDEEVVPRPLRGTSTHA